MPINCHSLTIQQSEESGSIFLISSSWLLYRCLGLLIITVVIVVVNIAVPSIIVVVVVEE